MNYTIQFIYKVSIFKFVHNFFQYENLIKYDYINKILCDIQNDRVEKYFNNKILSDIKQFKIHARINIGIWEFYS